MKIAAGLFDHIVLQRNARNVSEALITGTTDGGGVLRADVRGKRWSRKFNLGKIRGGTFNAVLKGIPAGGPYAIELRLGSAGETAQVHDVLVGDVWLLGGQSNMQGIGLLKDAEKSDPLVHAFYMDDRWEVARDPLHNLWQAKDPVHVKIAGGAPLTQTPGIGTGPGVAFGKQMLAYTGVPQGLIACGHGGSSMSQWSPASSSRDEGDTLYDALLRRLDKNGGRVAGLAWYQGCSDTSKPCAQLFSHRMRDLIATLRRATRDPRLPVVMVQIARVYNWDENNAVWWNSIQEQQRLLGLSIPRCATVPAIDLSMDDAIHISGRDQNRLGRRIAYAMNRLRDGHKAGLPPMQPGRIAIEPGRNGARLIKVKIRNVVGRLQAGSLPAGFELVGKSGIKRVIYDCKLQGNKVILYCAISQEDLGSVHLHYGYGMVPVCNITDEAGRSLPVMGPIKLVKPRARTDYIRTLRVSGFQPGAGKLHGLKYPAGMAPLKLAARTFSTDFCDMHLEIGPRAPQDLVVYYACRFHTEFKMDLTMLLGYDGPVKAWLDGRQVFHDPDGLNPAFPARGKVRFTAAQGEHEALVALGTNNGCAWGIFLNFERRDVAPALFAMGPGAYAMPVIMG